LGKLKKCKFIIKTLANQVPYCNVDIIVLVVKLFSTNIVFSLKYFLLKQHINCKWSISLFFKSL